MKTVPLHGAKAAGRVALVNDEDFDLVMQYRWNVWEHSRSGRPDRATLGPYAMAGPYRDGKQTPIYMHRLLTGYARTDHKDHNGLNNQRENLREATNAQNVANTRTRWGVSKYRGVTFVRKSGKWSAHITANGHDFYLGTFHLEEAAAWAYDVAAREHFGEFACPNFQAPGDPLGLTVEPIRDVVPPKKVPMTGAEKAKKHRLKEKESLARLVALEGWLHEEGIHPDYEYADEEPDAGVGWERSERLGQPHWRRLGGMGDEVQPGSAAPQLAETPPRTHCVNGHEWIPENLAPGPRGREMCRRCRLASIAKYKAKRRAKAA